jgi:hypothetical protein
MKTGKTLPELAAELERQRRSKRDFVADTRTLTMLNGIELSVGDQGEFGIRPIAHRQMGSRLDIPLDYYDRLLRSHPTLLDQNVNVLLRAHPAPWMVRTMDGQTRALLSNRYRRLDNDELAEAVLPILSEIPDVQFPSCEITESKMYIKAVAPRIQGEVKKGEIVQAGVIISNSEVGAGALRIEGMIYTLSCLNGAVTGDAVRRFHLGRQIEAEESAYEVFKDATLKADDHAFFLKVRDLTEAALSEARFQQVLARLKVTADTSGMDDPVKGVEELGRRFGLQEDEQASVLKHLIKGGDLTLYGALNAVTRAAQDVPSYDRSVELETAGGSMINWTSKDWTSVAHRELVGAEV